MDIRANNAELMNHQTKLRFFYDLAGQCNEHCVKDYKEKSLTTEEKDCVTSCFAKQTQIYAQLTDRLEKNKWGPSFIEIDK